MYIPREFNITDLDKQVEIIQSYPLGTLFSYTPPSKGLFGLWWSGDSDQYDSDLCATHLPFHFVRSLDGTKHKLVAHLAAGNQHANQLENTSKCLVTFQSVDSYISPSWYTLKEKTHKYVPTWDFAAVHVYGKPKVIRGDKEWLLNMLNHLTDQEEGKRPDGEQYKKKWKVSDAPERYVDSMLKGIVGLEIEIDHIESKFKFDQNKSKVDVEGIVANLENEVGGERGEKMANFTKEFSVNKK